MNRLPRDRFRQEVGAELDRHDWRLDPHLLRALAYELSWWRWLKREFPGTSVLKQAKGLAGSLRLKERLSVLDRRWAVKALKRWAKDLEWERFKEQDRNDPLHPDQRPWMGG